jgi:hypothetical protein
MTLAERLNQFNLARQMIRVVRTDAMQFASNFRVTISGSVCFMP